MRTSISTWIWLGLAALPLWARAAEAPMCRNGLFADSEARFGVARIVGAPRIYLRLDTAPCPDEAAACKGRAYVVPGNAVLTADAVGPYLCAYFPNAYGGSAGYLRRDEISPIPLPDSPPLTDWPGEWRDGDNRISLRVLGGKLDASGDTYWPARHPSPAQFPGGPNLGQFEGAATPKGSTAEYRDGDGDGACVVRLTLVGDFLIASDNRQCGGMNVTFSGVYTRAK